MDKKVLSEYYNRNSLRYREASDKERKILLCLSLLRLIVFVGGITLSWICFTISVFLGSVTLLIMSALFMLLLKIYTLHTGKKEHFENLVKINNDEVTALYGDYSLFGDGSNFADPLHDFSFDVDIFGKSSLFQYLNRASTGYGQEVLANWLADPYAQVENLISRQGTVKEIASKPEWRQEFLAEGMNKKLDHENIEGVLKWMNDDTGNIKTVWPAGLAWILPSVNIFTLILVATGLIHYSIFVSLFLLCLVLTLLNLTSTNRIHNDLSGRYKFLSSISSLLYLIEKEEFKSAELVSIQSSLKYSSVSV